MIHYVPLDDFLSEMPISAKFHFISTWKPKSISRFHVEMRWNFFKRDLSLKIVRNTYFSTHIYSYDSRCIITRNCSSKETFGTGSPLALAISLSRELLLGKPRQHGRGGRKTDQRNEDDSHFKVHLFSTHINVQYSIFTKTDHCARFKGCYISLAFY